MNSINTTDFRFSMVLPIRWNDLDPLNHVNNVFYFEYFQVGRGHYMLTASKQWDWTKNMFVNYVPHRLVQRVLKLNI